MADRCDIINVEYWSKRWASNDASWHKSFIQPCLEQHYQKLLPKNDGEQTKARIFVPLCGKSLDMLWLAEKGCQVVGLEGVEEAILEFFKENNVAYDVKTLDPDGIKCYSSLDKSKDISIYRMDVFKVTPIILGGTLDAIWDRGSLSAIGLYVENRGSRYADILSSLLRPSGCIMIENHVWFNDPGPNGGPPSHVPASVLKDLFGKNFDITPLEVDQSIIPKNDRYNRVYNLMRLKTNH
ncbi:uncharacterized protein LOC116304075 [Actinia tenebrosa]|uniref:thiopurine S-methyltransferase n=1 Tax=Actinia tenebrosa TaxID=6105 RepID=A0A6P8IRS8_ACTTE|nr:uncharacterized protein LOC116304075 [Actinia tenebrosa]